jgi:membrane-associated phospholipid phosphatase
MKIVESASPTRPLWRVDRMTALAIAGLTGFCIITILVQARLLASVDLAAAEAKQAFVSGVLDAFGAVVGIAVSGELSVVYGGIGAILLWRAGLDRWSLAPLAFVILVPLEIALKFMIHQPGVPSEFYRGVYYPLATVTLQGTFPSGHALRAGFLCAFPAILLARQRGTIGWLAPLGLGALAVLMGLSRVYLGDHWLSDVVAGLLLGMAMALLVAPPVAERLGDR